MMSGSGFLVESVQIVLGPISALTWAIDLPDGLICAAIGTVGRMKV